jgi:hypothetical protein
MQKLRYKNDHVDRTNEKYCILDRAIYVIDTLFPRELNLSSGRAGQSSITV